MKKGDKWRDKAGTVYTIQEARAGIILAVSMTGGFLGPVEQWLKQYTPINEQKGG